MGRLEAVIAAAVHRHCPPGGFHRPSSTGGAVPSTKVCGVESACCRSNGGYFEPSLCKVSCDCAEPSASGAVGLDGAVLVAGDGASETSSVTAAPPSRGPSVAPLADTCRTTMSPSTVSPTRNARAGLPSTAMSASPSLPPATTPTSLKRLPVAPGRVADGGIAGGNTRDTPAPTGAGVSPRGATAGPAATGCNPSTPLPGTSMYSATAPTLAAAAAQITAARSRVITSPLSASLTFSRPESTRLSGMRCRIACREEPERPGCIVTGPANPAARPR